MTEDTKTEADINNCRLELVIGDISEQDTDAIVNAANRWLAGGGGVDGAIHHAGGDAIMQETDERYPDGCPTGSAVPSGGGELAAKHVFHAVGPVWKGGLDGEEALLRSAYQAVMQLAREKDCASLALPALSTGAYRYPLKSAAKVAIATVCEFLRSHGRPELARFVLFDQAAFDAFHEALVAQVSMD